MIRSSVNVIVLSTSNREFYHALPKPSPSHRARASQIAYPPFIIAVMRTRSAKYLLVVLLMALAACNLNVPQVTPTVAPTLTPSVTPPNTVTSTPSTTPTNTASATLTPSDTSTSTATFT